MKTTIRNLFLPKKQKNKLRKTYVWTVLSGGLYSASTFLMFWITSVLCGTYEAGIFTMAMSVGQQLVTVGYFNVRTYQVSDVKELYSFSEYLMFRILTCCVMAAGGILWLFLGGYSREKMIAVGIMVLFKIAEAFADVLEGLYQQQDRYDTTGRCVFWETVLFLAAFTLVLAATGNLLLALGVMTGVYLLSLFLIDGNLIGAFTKIRIQFRFVKQKQLFLACLPLFINSFLVMYINNSSKYAIDQAAGPKALTYFNIIYMPAFVINLLGGFLLKPMITSMSLRFDNGEYEGFSGILKKQAVYIGGLTVLCVGGAWLLGIPVLSFIYGTDLSTYRTELCILVFGGAFSALYLMLQYAIIIMRHQYASLAGCVITAAAAWFLIPKIVSRWSVAGAAWGYLFLMVLMSAIYLIMTAYYYRKEKEHKKEGR